MVKAWWQEGPVKYPSLDTITVARRQVYAYVTTNCENYLTESFPCISNHFLCIAANLGNSITTSIINAICYYNYKQDPNHSSRLIKGTKHFLSFAETELIV